MSDDGYRKDRIGNRKLNPETLMLGYGYDPALSEGAVKPPVFLTSTFVFTSGRARQGVLRLRRRPPRAAGRRRRPASSTRASTTRTRDRRGSPARSSRRPRRRCSSPPACRRSPRRILAFARPGDVILHSQPLYGGTETLLTKTLTAMRHRGGRLRRRRRARRRSAPRPRRRPPWGASRSCMIETPSNPLNTLVDIALVRARRRRDRRARRAIAPVIVCDNTLLGPLFQKPLAHGADISVYSLTKYVGGHSDLIAGAALGSREVDEAGASLLRSAIGTQLDPHSCWMIGALARDAVAAHERAPAATPRSWRAFLALAPGASRKVYHPGLPAAGLRRSGGSTTAQCSAAGIDLLLRRRGRRGGGVPRPQRAAASSSSRSASAAPNRSPATRPRPPIPACRRRCATASASPTRRSASRSASSTRTTSSPTWRRRSRRWIEEITSPRKAGRGRLGESRAGEGLGAHSPGPSPQPSPRKRGEGARLAPWHALCPSPHTDDMAAPASPESYKEVILFLATAGVVVPLFHRLRDQPGARLPRRRRAARALRPRAARRARRRGCRWITIGNREEIAHLAEFGVVFLLFMIGLELSWERLRTLAAPRLRPRLAAGRRLRGRAIGGDRLRARRRAGAGRASSASRSRSPRRRSWCRSWRRRSGSPRRPAAPPSPCCCSRISRSRRSCSPSACSARARAAGSGIGLRPGAGAGRGWRSS